MDDIKVGRHGFRLRLPAKASFVYAISGFVSRALGLLFTPVFTRLLSKSEYGVFSLFLGWLTVYSAVSTLEIGTGIIYGGFSRFKEERTEFMKSALFTLISVFSALSLPVAFIIKRTSGLNAVFILLMAITALSDAVCSLYLTGERYAYRFSSVLLLNLTAAILTPLLALSLISKIPYYARPVSTAVLSLVTAGMALLRWRPWQDGRVKWQMVRFTLFTCLSLLPSFFASVLLSSADRLIIGARLGAEAVAKYSVAHSLGLALTFFTTGIFGAFKPWIMRRLDCGDVKCVWKICDKILKLGAAGTLLLTALAPEIFGILAPSEYADALAEVYVLAPAVMPMFLSGVYTSVLTFNSRGWLASVFGVLSAALSVVLNLLLVGRYSFTVSAIIFLISHTFLAVFGAIGTRARFWGSVCTLVLALGGVFVLYLLRSNLTLRLILLLPLTALGVFRALALIEDLKEA